MLKIERWLIHAQDSRSDLALVHEHYFQDYAMQQDAEHAAFEWRLRGWHVRIIDLENLEAQGLEPEIIHRFHEIIATQGGRALY